MSNENRRLITTALCVVSLGLCIVPLSFASPKATESQALPTLWAKEIQELMQRGDVPGLSIAVIRNGEIAWTHAFGYKNPITGQTDGPVRDVTLFPAASLGKPVFAYIVLRLADRGVVDLDKPLYEYLPNERLEHDERYKRITARMVLTHRSGLPNWGGTPLKLLFDPGEHYGYSGEGFMYLQAVVEKLTGQSLEPLAQQEVFTRLQMTHSTYTWSPTLADNLVSGDNGYETPQVVTNPKAASASSLLTTAEDYARFVLAIINGIGLKKETAERMLTSQSQVDLRNASPTISWGLGWGLEESDSGPYFWHGGNNGGFRSFVIASRSNREGLVYFTNSREGDSIVTALVGELLGGKHRAPDWDGGDQYDSPRVVARKELLQVYKRRGAQAGLARYRQLRETSPGVLDEEFTNDLGSDLRNQKKMDAAIALLQENVQNYPQSAATYDSLSWAYLTLSWSNFVTDMVEIALKTQKKP